MNAALDEQPATKKQEKKFFSLYLADARRDKREENFRGVGLR